jgi:hypothetical protein
MSFNKRDLYCHTLTSNAQIFEDADVGAIAHTSPARQSQVCNWQQGCMVALACKLGLDTARM